VIRTTAKRSNWGEFTVRTATRREADECKEHPETHEMPVESTVIDHLQRLRARLKAANSDKQIQ